MTDSGAPVTGGREPARHRWALLGHRGGKVLSWGLFGCAAALVATSVFLAVGIAGPAAGGSTSFQEPPAALPVEVPTAPSPEPSSIGSGPVARAVENARLAARKRQQDPKSNPAPVQIAIKQLGIDQKLINLRVQRSVLQVPKDYGDIGWWSDGPTPGSEGAATIVGHADSQVGPAVFYYVTALEKGAKISVKRQDGSVARFVVDRVERYAKDDFPVKKVYRLNGRPALHLITCGGEFDYATGQYTDNVVAFAYLTDVVKPKKDKAGENKKADKKKNKRGAKNKDQDQEEARDS